MTTTDHTTDTTADTRIDGVMARLEATRDALTVQRVFGPAYEAEGVTVIPVAAVRGGGGAGGGEGTGPDAANTGSGAGLGYGLSVRPLGVYEIRDGAVHWQPAVDVMRIVAGGQIVGGIALLVLARVLSRRRG